MLEIAATIVVSTLVMYAAIVAGSWCLHGRRAGPRERGLFVRWTVYAGLFCAAVAGWITAGIAIILSGSEFWRGAWVGSTAVLWLGYAPALLLVIRAGNRRHLEARAADGLSC